MYRGARDKPQQVSRLDLLTSLVEAAYARDKVGLLDQASRKMNSTRLLLRMAKDLKLMSIRR